MRLLRGCSLKPGGPPSSYQLPTLPHSLSLLTALNVGQQWAANKAITASNQAANHICIHHFGHFKCQFIYKSLASQSVSESITQLNAIHSLIHSLIRSLIHLFIYAVSQPSSQPASVLPQDFYRSCLQTLNCRLITCGNIGKQSPMHQWDMFS